MENIPELLKSKSFWSALAMIFAMFAVSVVPELADNEEQLIEAFTYIGMSLVAGHKIKDIALEYVKSKVVEATPES